MTDVGGLMTDCKTKMGKTAALALAIVLGGGLVMHGVTNVGHEADRAELQKLRGAYETAMNTGNFASLTPLLDKDFTYTTILGNDIKSAAEFEGAYKAVQAVIGANKGGSYKVAVNPALGKTNFWGDFAFTRGTTDETVITAEDVAGKVVKKTNNFGSLWFATAHKDNGAWKLVHAYAMFSKNPFSDQQVQDFTAALSKAAAAQAAPATPGTK
ncbi:MAG: hypothetical protein FD126_1178 [Elusimicrobia bacterium]|nr:MAG: hypothetical protein FD126_1178 [Elusimicrobiota bacterium]